MSEKRTDRHSVEHGKQGGEALDREQQGTAKQAIMLKTAMGIHTDNCIMPNPACVGSIWHKQP